MTVGTEFNLLIQEAQDRLPANPLSTKNLKLASDFEGELRQYFKAMRDSFPYDQMDALYYRHIKESLGSELDDIFEPYLRMITLGYFTRLNGRLAMIYIAGSVEMMKWGGVPYEGPPMQAAIDYASKRAGWLIKSMDTETKSRLAHLVSEGIKNKRGIPGLTSDIRKGFTDMSRTRARTIARTETSDALSQAFMDRAKDMNIEAKEWVTGGDPCPICAGNEADGVISMDKEFSSGHMRPPAHPNCVCALAPARLAT